MESKGFDGNECFIRVYIEEEHVPALRAAAEKAMALYHKGGITPNSSTGPELVLPDDLLKVMKWFVIDGMHRVTALQQLIAAHSDDKEKYRMVRAVLYLPLVIPHAVALAKACNKQTAVFVPSDSLEKISFIQGLLCDFEFIDDCSDVEQVFEKLGQGHLIISKSPKASQRIKAIKSWAYVKQLTQVARACSTDVMQKVAADLDRVEELNDEVKSTHSLTTKIKSVYVASNLDGRTDDNQNILGARWYFCCRQRFLELATKKLVQIFGICCEKFCQF